MKAKEARENAEQNSISINSAQYNEILVKIKLAVTNGLFSTDYSKDISIGIKSKLKRDGYSLKEGYHGQREEFYYTTISW